MDGYEKPKSVHTAKTRNMPAKENRVYGKGDNVGKENVEISTRNRGKKKRNLKRFGTELCRDTFCPGR